MPGTSQNGPCNVPLTVINGTGDNTVAVPNTQGAQYKSITEQLLYEIWQTNLLILAGQTGTLMVLPVTFTIGDGQAGTPLNGTNSLVVAGTIQGQSLTDKTIIVLRNGIGLAYSTGVTVNQINRKNTTTVSGGFQFDAGSGLTFQTGEQYSIYVIGVNTANA